MSKVKNIQCSEVVDISAVSDLYNRISSDMSDGCSMIIDASAIERIDAAGLQLFAALFNYAPTKNIEVKWQNPSDSLISAARSLDLVTILKLA